MKNLLYPLVFATAFVATACTSTNETDFDTPVDPNGKTAISFVGQSSNHGLTRAGFNNGSAQSITKIAMHIRSNKKSSTDVCETRTLAQADHDATQSTTSVSNVTPLSDTHTRYWDDAFGRDAQLSVFAIAVPGMPNPTNSNQTLEALLAKPEDDKVWAGTSLSEDVAWSVTTDQSDVNPSTIANEDLVYSNNIQGSNILKFDTNSGKFEKGNLQFTHALSRISVNLTKGTGFTESGSFVFTSTTGNVNLFNVPVSGKLNLVNGEWKDVNSGNITGMQLKSTTATAHSLMAQMLPGYAISRTGTSTNMLSFEIDKNTYYVTQAQMYEALTKATETDKAKITIGENSIVMQQGINYVFNVVVNKTSVVVTAKLATFEEVAAGDIDKDNSHGELTFNTSGNSNDAFILYRLEDSNHASATNWFGAYTAAAADQMKKEDGVWKTGWYFENDAAFYHFRAVSNNVTVANSTDGDYFNISSGTTDYHWGAPMNADATMAYDKAKGYESSISKAIRATTSTINLTELHMMSNIHVVLRTTTGKDAVMLEDKVNSKKCEVKLTNFYDDGKVNLGNGLVSVTSTDLTAAKAFTLPTDYSTETDASSSTHVKLKTPFTLYVVPQYVKRSSDAIGLTITTPDGNVYTIKDLSASTSTTFWEPNHQYTYTFTLTKAGVAVTCKVQNWVLVTAGDTDISLED